MADMTEIERTSSGDTMPRRDFLTISAVAVGAVGAAIAAWPLIDSMNPAADVTALSTVEIDLGKIESGQRVTVKWRGKPVFVDHRTATQITDARATLLTDLKDPETDDARVKRAEWLVVVGICTHLGCVPLGQKARDPRGEWAGWFCPCHGSHYDTSGRIRKGPAPRNLEVPPYAFEDNGNLKIG